MDLTTFTTALGIELRAIRCERKWTRQQVVDRMPSEVTIQAVGTYETGARQIPTLRLIALGEALGVPAWEVLRRALDRIADAAEAITVDLRAIVADTNPRYPAVAAWARTQLDAGVETVRMTNAAVQAMAVAIGRPVDQVAAYLAARHSRGGDHVRALSSGRRGNPSTPA